MRPLLLSRVASASQPVNTRQSTCKRAAHRLPLHCPHYPLPTTQYPIPTPLPAHYTPHYPHLTPLPTPLPASLPADHQTDPSGAAITTPSPTLRFNPPTTYLKKGGRSSSARIYCTRNTDLRPGVSLPRSQSMYSRLTALSALSARLKSGQETSTLPSCGSGEFEVS